MSSAVSLRPCIQKGDAVLELKGASIVHERLLGVSMKDVSLGPMASMYSPLF